VIFNELAIASAFAIDVERKDDERGYFVRI
jgi:hypothetical protein